MTALGIAGVFRIVAAVAPSRGGSMVRRFLRLAGVALFHSACALSLVACIAVVVLWVRSYSRSDHFWLMHRNGSAQLLRAASGDVEFMSQRTYYLDTSQRPWLRYEHSVGDYLLPSDPKTVYRMHGRLGPVRWGRSGPRPAPSEAEVRSRRAKIEEYLARAEDLERRSRAGDARAAVERAEFHAMAQALYLRPGPGWTVSAPAWGVVLVAGILPAVWLYRMTRRRHPPGHCRRCGYDLRGGGDRCPECGTAAPAAAGQGVG